MPRPSIIAHLLVSTLVLTTTLAHADTVILQASKDNSIYADAVTNSNGAGDNIFTGTNALGFARRAFVAFDVATSIPATAIVDSVVLQLSMSRTAFFAGAQAVSLHRVLADWGEGTSDAAGNEGQGAPATPNDVTWTFRFFNTVAWSTPGGVCAPTASDTRIVNDIGLYTWKSAAMRDDVQAWVNSPATNFGWVLLGNETAPSTAKRFDSSEDLLSPAHPQLTVYYRVPTSVDAVPAPAHLLAAAPNPFSGSTSLRFELSSPQAASLTVFDAAGHAVRHLASGEFSRGEHGADWNGRDDSGVAVGSGVYFVRLETNGRAVDTKRVVLVR